MDTEKTFKNIQVFILNGTLPQVLLMFFGSPQDHCTGSILSIYLVQLLTQLFAESWQMVIGTAYGLYNFFLVIVSIRPFFFRNYFRYIVKFSCMFYISNISREWGFLLFFVIQQGASIQFKIDKPLRQQQFSHRISYSHNCSILI